MLQAMKLLAIFTMTALAAGCTSETAGEDGPGGEATDESDFTSREGYAALRNPRGGVYVSVAAYGKRAFLGDNQRGIDIVDLTTMKPAGTIAGKIPADSLSVAGRTLAACGDRDDQPLNWDAVYGASDRNYIITLIDARTGAKKIEIALRLQKYLESSSSSGFIDLPNMACTLAPDGKSISVSFAQAKLQDEVVTFPLPAASISYDFREIPGATRVKVGTSADNTVTGFSSGPLGLTYAAGGYGLRRIAPNQTAPRSLRDQDREHLLGLMERGDRLFTVNHDGALLVLDAQSGATVASVDVPDWLEGVAFAGSYVLAVGRAGLMVTKDRWAR